MTRSVRLLTLLAAVVFAVALGIAFGPELVPLAREAVDRLATAGPLGAVVFVLVYTLATVALFPGLALALVAGAAYGIALGSALAFLGAALGAMAAFRISKRLSHRSLESGLALHPRLAAFDHALARDGLRTAFLLRLSPVVPYNVLNYALGATHIRARDAALACVGMLPGTVLYVAGGRMAAEASGVVETGSRGRSPVEWAVLAVGIGATALVTVLLARMARLALRSARRTVPPAPRSAPTDGESGAGQDANNMRT